MIQVVTIKDFRKSFEKYADDVANYNETIIVARPEQKNVVVISEKEYNSWQETNYLLQSKANNNTLALIRSPPNRFIKSSSSDR